jgi:hypothetical protein
MDGNVSRGGIAKDLAWLKRVGVGGVNQIDVSFGQPPVVPLPAPYFSPAWERNLRFTATEAKRLGLALSMNVAPGWSGTGGPGTPPQDAMKKLVWSSLDVNGGEPLPLKVTQPPVISGPFQNVAYVPRNEFWTDVGRPSPTPDMYRDVAVLAFRTPQITSVVQHASIVTAGSPLDKGLLTDHDLSTSVSVPTNSGTALVSVVYREPTTIRTMVLGIPRPMMAAYASVPVLTAQLEAQDSAGAYHLVASTSVGIAPQVTLSFPAVTARTFRLVLKAIAFAPSSAQFPDADPRLFPAEPESPHIALSELRLEEEARVNEAERKAGYALSDDYDRLENKDDSKGIAPTEIIDLTSRTASDGTLDWTPPAGRWTVMRFGYSLTGMLNFPAPREATGLEIDKLNCSVAERYMSAYLSRISKMLAPGPMSAQALKALTSDSTEAGPQNWTDDMLAQFRRLRGYDATLWLPALTGQIIGSASQTDKFLWDFRKTIADLRSECHQSNLARISHEYGLALYAESLEGGRPELGDDLQMRASADFPMGAMWAFLPGDPLPESAIADARGAASVGHLYGRPIIAAESFTRALLPWGQSPRDLKPVADLEFASGINRIVIHTSVHQPLDRPPGITLGVAGQDFTRLNTWAADARAWIEYLARSSFLLQQGSPVSDVAYFYGESTPAGTLGQLGKLTDVPKHYGYDFVDSDALLNLIAVEGGKIVTPGGMRYRLLQLGQAADTMTVPVLRRLQMLADQGATIIGDAPHSSPSLADDPRAFKAMVDALWGRGRIRSAVSADAALASIGVPPDWTTTRPELRLVHRHIPNGEIYFVSNGTARPTDAALSLRVSGKTPSLWRADRGSIDPTSFRVTDGRTEIPLHLGGNEAIFIVFRGPGRAASCSVPAAVRMQPYELPGNWKVDFSNALGERHSAVLSLASWSDDVRHWLRYFSGSGSYTKTVVLPKRFRNHHRLILDLGDLRDIARVIVNGKHAGTVWNPPYAVDVSRLLRPGRNRLRIVVTNLWVNRLIGAQNGFGPDRLFTSVPTYSRNARLRLAGLLGPVKIERLRQPTQTCGLVQAARSFTSIGSRPGPLPDRTVSRSLKGVRTPALHMHRESRYFANNMR